MRFLSYDALKEKGITYSKPHLWRLIKAKRFPPPIKGLGAENVWSETEVDDVITARIAARDGPQAA
jgi:prophage regulatory protein